MPMFATRSVVLFDFDGTIADTGPAVIRCASGALAAHGIDPAAVGDLRRFIGPPLVNGFMEVAGVTRAEAQPLVATYRALFASEVKPEDYPLLPGIPELLDGLRRRDARLAVATSRLESSACAMLAHLAIPPFDAVAGRLEPGRDTKEECIRAALALLGASPDDAVHVGDRRHDVEGAHAAGVPCIGIYQDEPGRLELEEAGADAVCAGAWEAARLLGVTV